MSWASEIANKILGFPEIDFTKMLGGQINDSFAAEEQGTERLPQPAPQVQPAVTQFPIVTIASITAVTLVLIVILSAVLRPK